MSDVVTVERVTIPPTGACQGCAMVLISRHALDTLGRNSAVIIPASCGAWSGAMLIDRGPTQFPSAAAAASGVARGLKAAGHKNTNVVVIAGDGGTYDIGLQALSGAAERGERIIYICQNNQAYMNTGIQRSGATPRWAWTTTTPIGSVIQGKTVWPKSMPEIMEAHHIPLVATASIHNIPDYKRKIKLAQRLTTEEGKGLSYIEVLNTCPTGWRYSPEKMVTMARLAVETGFWPVYEVVEGKFKLNIKPKTLKPLKEFLQMQGRFRHLTDEQIAEMERWVHERWQRLLERDERGY
ncbi:pyruvate synthase subunit beta [Candidatus Bathyarchaeota archaeon]|nr:pyruvate synthase subunit beta [Candidatus Bathyarchaeota archaeon]